MPDLLPDVPADLWNNWSADQFAQAAQEKIASLPSDISQGVQNILAPPAPSTPQPVAPEPAQEPTPDAVTAPAPPPPPEPAPAPPPPAPTDTTSAPPDISAPPVAPDLSAPAPTPPAPDLSAPPAPTPAPTPASSPSPTTSSPGNWDIGALLGAADSAGADMQAFTNTLNQHLQSTGGDMLSSALGAADAAGADMQQFAGKIGDLVPQAAQQAQQGAQQAAASVGGAIDSSSRQAFASSFAPYAQYAAQQLGIDPAWVEAMAGSESNFGKAAGNELFGIKALPGQPGTSMMTHEGEYGGTNMAQTFASYDTPLDAVNAYVDLLKNHYPGAVGAPDLGTFVHGLKQGGYFTAAEDEYKGILGSIADQLTPGMQSALSGAQGVVQQAADTGQTAVNSVSQAAQSAAARTSQFGMGLSSGDAMAFCGPAAAMAFAETFGRNPTVDEAKQLAAQVGWNPAQGMAGPSSEVSLLQKLGIDTHMTQGVNWSQVAQDASSGNPVIIDTPGHYFYVDGYNADTGQYHLGTSATDLRVAKGQEWFTPDQIPSLGMGDPRAAIFADHPLSGAGVASAATQGVGNAVNAITDFTGQASQRAQDTLSAVLSTGVNTMQDALANPAADWLDSQRQKLTDSLSNASSTVGQDAQDVLSALRGNAPTDQDARWAAAQQAAQQQTGSSVNLPGNPLDLLSSMSPYGIGQAGQQLTDWRNQFIAQNNPLRDIPFLGGASTLLGQSTIGDPTNLLLAAGPELGLTTAGVGRDALSLLADPAVQAALRYRQAGESDVNFALGGIPAALNLGGEGAQSMEASLPENASNAARAVFNAAVQGNIEPSSGAGMLSRALDALSAYPDEVADPIRSFAAATDAAPSDVANTIQRWILDNPTTTVPNPITGPSALARDAGQQAVRDIADVVNSGHGNITQFPAGSIPDLLAQGSSADQVLQELLDNLTGKPAPQPRIPGTAGYLPPGTMPGQMDLGLGSVADLTNRIPQTADAGTQAWLQQVLSRGAQQGLPIGGEGSLLDELAAGARNQAYPPEQTLGTYQMRMQPGSTPIQDIINELTGSPAAGPTLPKGVTPDMAQALHAYIDTLDVGAGTPHTDLNNLLATPGVNPADVERFMGQLEGRTPNLQSGNFWADMVRQLRTGSMAGGLSTELKVLASPVIQTAMRAPAGALKLIMQGRASDIPDGLVGGFAGLGSGAEEALQTLKYGTNWRSVMTRSDGGGYGFSPGLDVMGTNGFQRALGTALMGLVRTHGAVGDITAGIGRGANAALGATPEAAQEAGQQWALRSGNYGYTGQKVASMLGQLRGSNPALNVLGQIIMPFYRIAYNTTTGGIERSPVGFAGRAIDAMQGKPLDQAKLANNLFGTGLFALALKEAGDGNITGDNPQGGAPKQSVQLPGIGYVPLRFLGMAAEPLAQAASVYEAARDNQGDVGGMAQQAASEYLGHVKDESWVGDMANFFNTITDLTKAGNPGSRTAALANQDLAYQLGSIGKSFIPQEKLGEQALGALQGLQARGGGGATRAPAGRPTTLTTRPSTTTTSTSGRPTTRAAR